MRKKDQVIWIIGLELLCFGILLLVNLVGCATMNPHPSVTVVSGGKGLPPQPPLELLVYIWNESGYGVAIVLDGPRGRTKIYLAADEELLQPLTRGGEYRYFVTSTALGMFGETESSFQIVPGETREYRGRIAGYHLVIDRLNWKDKPSRRFFGAGATNGEIHYGSHEDTVRGSVGGVEIPAEVRLGGGFAVLNRILTRR